MGKLRPREGAWSIQGHASCWGQTRPQSCWSLVSALVTRLAKKDPEGTWKEGRGTPRSTPGRKHNRRATELDVLVSKTIAGHGIGMCLAFKVTYEYADSEFMRNERHA